MAYGPAGERRWSAPGTHATSTLSPLSPDPWLIGGSCSPKPHPYIGCTAAIGDPTAVQTPRTAQGGQPAVAPRSCVPPGRACAPLQQGGSDPTRKSSLHPIHEQQEVGGLLLACCPASAASLHAANQPAAALAAASPAAVLRRRLLLPAWSA